MRCWQLAVENRHDDLFFKEELENKILLSNKRKNLSHYELVLIIFLNDGRGIFFFLHFQFF
jgi:hypothetical protein